MAFVPKLSDTVENVCKGVTWLHENGHLPLLQKVNSMQTTAGNVKTSAALNTHTVTRTHAHSIMNS